MIAAVVAFVIAYSCSSYVLLRRPWLVHKKKCFPFEARHISHRGGAGEKIENTLNAFIASHAAGTEMFELDCHLTNDNQVVVFHDITLNRCTGFDGDIKNFNYNELPPYLSRLEVHLKPGFFCDQLDSLPCRVLLLEELFRRFPSMPMNIDIKVDDNTLIEEVAQLIEKYNREKLTVWGSVHPNVCMKCCLRNPNILTFASRSHGLWTVAFYILGLLPFIPLSYDCFEMPLMSVIRKPELLRRNKLDGFMPRLMLSILDYCLTSPGLIRHLRLRGIPVFIWVCNTDEEYMKAFELGASGVMTDYPSQLTSFLKNNPHFPKQI